MGWGITTPFGITMAGLGAQTQALMFPGQYEDAETTGAGVTLSHNWHRTYDPTLGRYLQADPVGLRSGLNRYAYVGGNPINAVDPEGLDELLFNGDQLILVDDNEWTVLRRWSAVSGFQPNRKGCGCIDEQEKSDFGPIPNGEYTVSRQDSNYRNWLNDNLFRDWGPEAAWGNARTLIRPNPGTNTFGRSGMYIHGGNIPGSAGCVDLTNDNDDFHKWLKSQKSPVDLTVRNRGTGEREITPRIKP